MGINYLVNDISSKRKLMNEGSELKLEAGQTNYFTIVFFRAERMDSSEGKSKSRKLEKPRRGRGPVKETSRDLSIVLSITKLT